MNDRKPIDFNDEFDPLTDDVEQLDDGFFRELDFQLEREVADEGLYESIQNELNLEELLSEMEKEFYDELSFDEE